MKNVAYTRQSTLYKKIHNCLREKKTVRFAFLDIDFTLSSQIEILPDLMKKLSSLDYVIAFATARTEEMLMDTNAYNRSRDLGFTRPVPHLSKKEGKYVYENPRNVHPLLINPDIIIASTGTEILLRQEDGGYIKDHSYESHVTKNWRQETLKLLDSIDQENKFFSLAPIEFEENYYKGQTDVFPTNFRVHINFNSLSAKIEFLKKIKEKISYETFFEKSENLSLTIIDDSNPKENAYRVHITPPHMDKGYAVDHVLKKVKTEYLTSSQLGGVNVLLAGDSYPDLSMLLRSADGTNATAIVVGGARIAEMFTNENTTTFAGEDIQYLRGNLKKGKIDGEYSYNSRKIIIGDILFPGTIGPQTIIQYLIS